MPRVPVLDTSKIDNVIQDPTPYTNLNVSPVEFGGGNAKSIAKLAQILKESENKKAQEDEKERLREENVNFSIGSGKISRFLAHTNQQLRNKVDYSSPDSNDMFDNYVDLTNKYSDKIIDKYRDPELKSRLTVYRNNLINQYGHNYTTDKKAFISKDLVENSIKEVNKIVNGYGAGEFGRTELGNKLQQIETRLQDFLTPEESKLVFNQTKVSIIRTDIAVQLKLNNPEVATDLVTENIELLKTLHPEELDQLIQRIEDVQTLKNNNTTENDATNELGNVNGAPLTFEQRMKKNANDRADTTTNIAVAQEIRDQDTYEKELAEKENDNNDGLTPEQQQLNADEAQIQKDENKRKNDGNRRDNEEAQRVKDAYELANDPVEIAKQRRIDEEASVKEKARLLKEENDKKLADETAIENKALAARKVVAQKDLTDAKTVKETRRVEAQIRYNDKHFSNATHATKQIVQTEFDDATQIHDRTDERDRLYDNLVIVRDYFQSADDSSGGILIEQIKKAFSDKTIPSHIQAAMEEVRVQLTIRRLSQIVLYEGAIYGPLSEGELDVTKRAVGILDFDHPKQTIATILKYMGAIDRAREDWDPEYVKYVLRFTKTLPTPYQQLNANASLGLNSNPLFTSSPVYRASVKQSIINFSALNPDDITSSPILGTRNPFIQEILVEIEQEMKVKPKKMKVKPKQETKTV